MFISEINYVNAEIIVHLCLFLYLIKCRVHRKQAALHGQHFRVQDGHVLPFTGLLRSVCVLTSDFV